MTSLSDMALTLPESAPRSHDTFPAEYVTRYLEEYVDGHVYEDRPLRDRIWLGTEVTSAEKSNSGWLLRVEGASNQTIRCCRLAVASGLTSLPIMPEFCRNSHSMVPVLHHRDFGAHYRAILAESSTFEHFTVLGGGKSAADMVYASVKAGKDVSWVIRKSGEGPGIFMNPAATGRYRNAAEVGFTQTATTLNPSGFHPMLPSAQALHQSISGRATLYEKLFAADRRYKAWANYKARDGALPGFHELEPSAS